MKKLIFILLLGMTCHTNAQTWKAMGRGITGANQNGSCSVNTMVTDTNSNRLYVGGLFKYAGDSAAAGLAYWDGSDWFDLNYSGGTQTGAFNGGMCIYQNILWIGSHGLARWNGSSFLSSISANGDVYALAEWNGKLIVGGDFTKINSVTVGNLAQYDGTTWSSVGGGVSGCPGCSVVNALTVWNGNLVIGGIFTQAGSTPANNVAVWDGTTFTALGSGISDVGGSFGGGVYALATYKGDIIVGGGGTLAGGNPAKYIAGWDGIQWYPISTGMQSDVLALKVFHDELYIAGGFIFGSGWNRVAKWNGYILDSLDSPGTITNVSYALEVYNDDLIIGGAFNTSPGQSAFDRIVAYDYIPTNTQNSLCTQPDCNGTASADTAYRVSPIKYKWSTGDSTQIITNLCAGSYTVTVTDSTGEAVQGTAIITSPAALTIKDTTTNATCVTCADGSAGVTVSGGISPYTYNWSNSNTTNSITNQLPDTFIVTITDSNGCMTRDTVVIGFSTNAWELQIENYKLQIAPNPVTDKLIISNSSFSTTTIKVMDLLGKTVIVQSAGNKEGVTEASVSGLPPGMYLLSVKTKQGISVTKFVKQ